MQTLMTVNCVNEQHYEAVIMKRNWTERSDEATVPTYCSEYECGVCHAKVTLFVTTELG